MPIKHNNHLSLVIYLCTIKDFILQCLKGICFKRGFENKVKY